MVTVSHDELTGPSNRSKSCPSTNGAATAAFKIGRHVLLGRPASPGHFFSVSYSLKTVEGVKASTNVTPARWTLSPSGSLVSLFRSASRFLRRLCSRSLRSWCTVGRCHHRVRSGCN